MQSSPTDPDAWPRDNDPEEKCCGCARHTISILASFRSRLIPGVSGPGTDFSEWSSYSDSYLSFVAENTGPDGSETQMRYMMTTNTPSAVEVGPCVVRYRRIVFFDTGVGSGEFTQFVSDDTIEVWHIDEAGGSIEYYLPPCDEGTKAFMGSGPAGAGGAGISCRKGAAKLIKKGFLQYDGGGDRTDPGELKIYRREEVTGANAPGCVATGRPSRLYSGAQAFTQVLASSANGYLTDPCGTYDDTRSANLIADKYGATLFNLKNETLTFGTVYTPVETLKNMTENFLCGESSLTKFVQLTLSALYLTSLLQDNVNSAVTTQLANLPVGDTNWGVAAGTTAVMHRYYLSSDETVFAKLKTYEATASTGAGDYGSGLMFSLLDPGGSGTRTVKFDVVTRDMDTGQTADSEMSLTTEFWSNNALEVISPPGRTLRGPISADGEFPPEPLHEPYPESGPVILNREVYWDNPRCKGHFYLVEAFPFVEPVSVIDDGWEG